MVNAILPAANILGVTVQITDPATTGNSVALTKSPDPNAGEIQRVFNDSNQTVYLSFAPSGGSVTVANGHPLPAGAGQDFIVDPQNTHAYTDVASNATGNVYFTPIDPVRR